MQNLASGVLETLLKTLWLGRLSTHIQTILVVLERRKVEEMTSIANKIHDMNTNMYVASVGTARSTIHSGQNKITLVRQEINQLRTEIRSRSTNISRNRSRPRFQTIYRGNSTICIITNVLEIGLVNAALHVIIQAIGKLCHGSVNPQIFCFK